MEREGRLDLFRTLVEARALEEAIQGAAAFYHSGFGMEAVGVGVASALRPDDSLVAHYRGVAAPLAKGMTATALVRSFLLKSTSPVRGRNWHPVDVELGLFGHQGTSGSEFGRAAGLAVAAKSRGHGAVAAAIFGDGSAQRGTLHEAFLMASAWKLPVLWVCENNGFMISTRADTIFPGDVAELAAGYHFDSEIVDGNDVFAVRDAVERLVARAREDRPVLLEAKTYRVRPHTEVEAAPYQDAAEIEEWRARDPIVVARAHLTGDDGVSADELDALERDVRAAVTAALETVQAEPGHSPDEDVHEWLYATPVDRSRDPGHDVGAGTDTGSPPRSEMSFFDAIKAGIRAELAADPTVMLWGENVEDPYGGLLQQYAGLSTEFPGRVKDSPLAETAIVGAALGAAMAGLRPIADIQIADFSFVAMEELVRAPRWRHMHGGAGDVRVPMVVKTLVGGYLGVGANHSQLPTGYWLHTPGLKVAFPSTANDAYGLMRAAIRDDDVVVVCAHKLFMFSTGTVVEEPIPLGRAAIRRVGTDVTIVAIGYMNDLALQAAGLLAVEGVEVEIVDPRTLEPFDLDTVLASVAKTGRLVVVDEDHVSCGVAGELCMRVLETAPAGTLRSRPRRVRVRAAPAPRGPGRAAGAPLRRRHRRRRPRHPAELTRPDPDPIPGLDALPTVAVDFRQNLPGPSSGRRPTAQGAR